MRWLPLTMDYLLDKEGLKSVRLQALLGIWVGFIALSLLSVFLLGAQGGYFFETSQNPVHHVYLVQAPMLIGTLLVFWLGYEWGFIPAFLAAFFIAFAAFMTNYWAILYGISYGLGLTIYALAYYCVPFDISLRSLRSVAFFTVVSFVAALACSLGAFVWSGYFDLSVVQTSLLWKSWWTGLFLQSILLVGPLLFFFTPTIRRAKERYFHTPPHPDVSLNWIYTAIASVSVVLILFLFSAKMLGTRGLMPQLAELPEGLIRAIQSVISSFEMVTWISIGLVLMAGIGGIYLVGSWNVTLQEKVNQQTKKLQRKERSLQKALDDRDLLLTDIHDRVRTNLSMVLALLEVQLKNKDKNSKPIEEILKDSLARIRSMAIIHETMAQSESVAHVHLKSYAIKLSNRLGQAYKKQDQNIEVNIQAEDLVLDIERAVPFAMILNELMVNAYSHAFKELNKGSIYVEITKEGEDVEMSVRDNGIGLPDNFDNKENQKLGMRLVRTLAKKLRGELVIKEANKTTSFTLRMPYSPIAA